MKKKIIITSGQEVGGVQSFADSLAQGFIKNGFDCKIMSPLSLACNFKFLFSDHYFKILSTSAVFLCLFSKNAICVAHGLPTIKGQGLGKFILVLLSLYLAHFFSKIISVSHYTSRHLHAIFGIKSDRVIHNPINSIYLYSSVKKKKSKSIVFVGRLHDSKNLKLILPALKGYINNNSEVKLEIVGYGSDEKFINNYFNNTNYIFHGKCDSNKIREVLINSDVFISGCVTEGFGLTYLEALFCGCKLVMPSSGGGLEILSPYYLNKIIFPFNLSFDSLDIERAIEAAFLSEYDIPLDELRSNHSPDYIAAQYYESMLDN